MAHASMSIAFVGAVEAGDKDGLASYLASWIRAPAVPLARNAAVVPAVAPHIAIAELIQLSSAADRQPD